MYEVTTHCAQNVGEEKSLAVELPRGVFLTAAEHKHVRCVTRLLHAPTAACAT